MFDRRRLEERKERGRRGLDPGGPWGYGRGSSMRWDEVKPGRDVVCFSV